MLAVLIVAGLLPRVRLSHAVVAGIVFFFIRAGFALVPSLANRHSIKKWAAFGALSAATFYLLLSGAEVATQRSYIMIAIVLVGVMLDRPTLTFRTISVAAIAVLTLAPQAVVHPSFQMSFAATLALIAAYQHGLPWNADRDSSLGLRMAMWGVREFAGLILASLVAGLATTPYAAYHFHAWRPTAFWQICLPCRWCRPSSCPWESSGSWRCRSASMPCSGV